MSGTLEMLNKSSKVLRSGSIFLVILLATSLLSTQIQNSKALVQENEETAYLKFVSQTVNGSNSSSSTNQNSTTSTVQIPEAAK